MSPEGCGLYSHCALWLSPYLLRLPPLAERERERGRGQPELLATLIPTELLCPPGVTREKSQGGGVSAHTPLLQPFWQRVFAKSGNAGASASHHPYASRGEGFGPQSAGFLRGARTIPRTAQQQGLSVCPRGLLSSPGSSRCQVGRSVFFSPADVAHTGHYYEQKSEGVCGCAPRSGAEPPPGTQNADQRGREAHGASTRPLQILHSPPLPPIVSSRVRSCSAQHKE